MTTPAESTTTTMAIDYGDSRVYPSNFCRLNSTPEEVIVDFGVQQTAKVEIQARVMMSLHAAKRLRDLLSMVIQKHEDIFGQVVLDAAKRQQPKPAT